MAAGEVEVEGGLASQRNSGPRTGTSISAVAAQLLHEHADTEPQGNGQRQGALDGGASVQDSPVRNSPRHSRLEDLRGRRSPLPVQQLLAAAAMAAGQQDQHLQRQQQLQQQQANALAHMLGLSVLPVVPLTLNLPPQPARSPSPQPAGRAGQQQAGVGMPSAVPVVAAGGGGGAAKSAWCTQQAAAPEYHSFSEYEKRYGSVGR